MGELYLYLTTQLPLLVAFQCSVRENDFFRFQEANFNIFLNGRVKKSLEKV